jgi:hypothetical protein
MARGCDPHHSERTQRTLRAISTPVAATIERIRADSFGTRATPTPSFAIHAPDSLL